MNMLQSEQHQQQPLQQHAISPAFPDYTPFGPGSQSFEPNSNLVGVFQPSSCDGNGDWGSNGLNSTGMALGSGSWSARLLPIEDVLSWSKICVEESLGSRNRPDSIRLSFDSRHIRNGGFSPYHISNRNSSLWLNSSGNQIISPTLLQAQPAGAVPAQNRVQRDAERGGDRTKSALHSLQMVNCLDTQAQPEDLKNQAKQYSSTNRYAAQVHAQPATSQRRADGAYLAQTSLEEQHSAVRRATNAVRAARGSNLPPNPFDSFKPVTPVESPRQTHRDIVTISALVDQFPRVLIIRLQPLIVTEAAVYGPDDFQEDKTLFLFRIPASQLRGKLDLYLMGSHEISGVRVQISLSHLSYGDFGGPYCFEKPQPVRQHIFLVCSLPLLENGHVNEPPDYRMAANLFPLGASPDVDMETTDAHLSAGVQKHKQRTDYWFEPSPVGSAALPFTPELQQPRASAVPAMTSKQSLLARAKNIAELDTGHRAVNTAAGSNDIACGDEHGNCTCHDHDGDFDMSENSDQEDEFQAQYNNKNNARRTHTDQESSADDIAQRELMDDESENLTFEPMEEFEAGGAAFKVATTNPSEQLIPCPATEIIQRAHESLNALKKKVHGQPKHKYLSLITPDDILSVTIFQRDDLASQLGICLTLMKKIFRNVGFTYWPYRKLNSLLTKMFKIQNDAAMGSNRRTYGKREFVERQRQRMQQVETQFYEVMRSIAASARKKLQSKV